MNRLLRAFLALTLTLPLAACIGYSDHGRGMQNDYPNLINARKNAELGLHYLHQGYTDLANEKLMTAIKQGPEDANVLGAVGFYYEKTGEIDQANRYFYAAMLYNPNAIAARKNYAAFLCRNGYYQESLQYFSQINPTIANTDAEKAYCTQELQQALGDRARYAYDTQNG